MSAGDDLLDDEALTDEERSLALALRLEQEEQAALLQARMEQEQAFARMAELGPDDQESLGRRLPQSGNPLVVCCLSPDRGSPPVLCAPQRWPFGCSRRKTSSSCAARSGAASARRTWGGSYDRFF